MRDFVGADDLSFTPAEQEAIRRAAGMPLQIPALPGPNRRGWILGAVGIVTFLWWIVPADILQRAAPTETSSPPLVTVAIARAAVHLREGPSASSRSVGVIRAGSLVTVAQQRADGFDQVRHGNTQGYAAAMYLAVSDGVELLPQIGTRIGQVTGNVRVREQASLSAMPIAALPAYSPVTVLGFTPRGWCLVWTGTQAGFVWGGLMVDHPSLPFHPGQEGTARVVLYNRKVLRP